MNGHGSGPGTPARVVGIGSAVALMVGAILAGEPYLSPTTEGGEGGAATVRIEAARRPIAAEADRFRTLPGDLAPPPEAPRRPDAHGRTLAMWRATRAYPGAPPRIPHGLRADEFRATACNACHRRGGWVPRFASYAPVAPHPDDVSCLQCHVPDDALVGRPFPDRGPDALCRQCHTPEVERGPYVEIDWPSPSWPVTDQRALPDAPPPIPHDLQLRGNCVACHAAPGAVEEIRTSHPERSDCRQCHVRGPAPGEDEQDVFVRPSPPADSVAETRR